MNKKKAARKSYETKVLGLGMREPVTTEAQFKAMHDRLSSKLNSAKGAYDDAVRKIDEYDKKAKELRAEAASKRRELASVEHTKSRFRGDLARLREAVCRGTGIPITSLPFAGELIEVKQTASEWRPTLELLLGSFGRSMLIEEGRFREVMKFLHRNQINGRLDFNRVNLVPVSVAENKAGDSSRVFSLLKQRAKWEQ